MQNLFYLESNYGQAIILSVNKIFDEALKGKNATARSRENRTIHHTKQVNITKKLKIVDNTN